MKKYVLGFAFNAMGNKVVLIKKNRPAWQNGKLNGVGGKVEGNETFIDAMIREFFEETGVQTDKFDWINYASMIFQNDILGGGAEISVFKLNDTGIVSSVSTCTDEEISLIHVFELSDHRLCPNVTRLINLALQNEFGWTQLYQQKPE